MLSFLLCRYYSSVHTPLDKALTPPFAMQARLTLKTLYLSLQAHIGQDTCSASPHLRDLLLFSFTERQRNLVNHFDLRAVFVEDFSSGVMPSLLVFCRLETVAFSTTVRAVCLQAGHDMKWSKPPHKTRGAYISLRHVAAGADGQSLSCHRVCRGEKVICYYRPGKKIKLIVVELLEAQT